MLPNACPKPRKSKKRVRVSLKHGKPLKRVRMRNGAGSKRRGGHMFPKNVDEARRAFIRAQACVVTGRATGEWIRRESWMPQTLPVGWRATVVCAHVKSRGSGGVDQANMVPLDSRIHDWQGQLGWPRFVKKLKLEAPAEIAEEYERRYLVEGGGIPEHL